MYGDLEEEAQYGLTRHRILCGELESQSFYGSMIQSILDHNQFLFCDRVYQASLEPTDAVSR